LQTEVGSGVTSGTQPLVSCIIIFLDEEKYLAEAIQSVLAQTYENWELILVDDGSSDRSAEIAREYVARRPDRIRYLTHPKGMNCGMSASRNLGLRDARGLFVAFLDGDDIWYPDKLERQIELLNEHPDAVMVSGASLYWRSWEADNPSGDRVVPVGQVPGADGSSLRQDQLYAAGTLMKELYPLGRGTTPSSSGMMIRRDTALAVGGFEPSFRGLFEDQVFLAKVLLAGPAYVSQTIFDRYRQHGESCSSVTRNPSERNHLRRRYLGWLKGYLDHIGCRDSVIRAKLRLAMLRIDHPWAYDLLAGIRRLMRRAVSE
jgi:glycosyltransferase involved in cell wall biosynthesis